ncbi:hypothetical protein [uncultured Jatrophihabitans sp.]|uniref:arsenate reductase/protein-tyrosine-phosphatase family protein n=1 Tax=uncultured Jatrophihabitans sp. TaxID=1610747 RepID=UPI0035CCA876
MCTGNIHRSAMAERLMIGRSDLSLPVTIASAGVNAVVGHPMAANSMTAAAELGADPSEHIARQFVPPLAERADLILTAERAHRERILEDSPRAMRRTFTLRRFCWLAAALGPPDCARPTTEQLRARVSLIAAQPRTPAQTDEDIADPVRASLEETRLRAREIADCVDVVVATLGLGRRDPA